MNNNIDQSNKKYILGTISKVESHIYRKNDPWYPYILSAHYKASKNKYQKDSLKSITDLLNKKGVKYITEYDFNVEGFDDLFVFLDINDEHKDLFKVGNKIKTEISDKDYFFTVKSVNSIT